MQPTSSFYETFCCIFRLAAEYAFVLRTAGGVFKLQFRLRGISFLCCVRAGGVHRCDSAFGGMCFLCFVRAGGVSCNSAFGCLDTERRKMPLCAHMPIQRLQGMWGPSMFAHLAFCWAVRTLRIFCSSALLARARASC